MREVAYDSVVVSLVYGNMRIAFYLGTLKVFVQIVHDDFMQALTT